MQEGPAGRRRYFRILAAPLLIVAGNSIAWAQENPPEPSSPSLPPAIESPPVEAKAADDETSPRQLLERLKKMEKTIQDLNDHNQELEEKYKHITKELEDARKKDQAPKSGQSKSYMDPLPPGFASRGNRLGQRVPRQVHRGRRRRQPRSRPARGRESETRQDPDDYLL